MKILLRDPEAPLAALPGSVAPRPAGAGVGGRRYLRLDAPGPWGGSLFGKDFGPGRRARARAVQEFRRAVRLRAAGGPCPRPWQVAMAGDRTILWSEDLGTEAALGRQRFREDPALLAAAARAAAALHRAGALHGDLHPGNLLRHPGGSLLWTDLRQLRFTSSAAADRRAAELGHFAADLEPLPPRRLLALARAYLEAFHAGAPASGALKEFARRVDAGAAARLRAHQANLDRRARRVLRGPHPALWRDEGLRPHQGLLEREAAQGPALKAGSHSRVVRVRLPDGTSVVVKHFGLTKRVDPRNRMGRSKAMTGLAAAEGLRRRGLPAARPLAAWSRPAAGSWLVLEDLARHRPLHAAASQVRGRARSALLREVARLVRRMHRAGVYYRDLKPSNVLVDPDAPPERRLALVDHDRNRFSRRPVPPARARRDLAALHAGLPPEVRAAERFRALRAYGPRWTARGLWRKHVRPLLREAAARRHRWIPRALLGPGGAEAR